MEMSDTCWAWLHVKQAGKLYPVVAQQTSSSLALESKARQRRGAPVTRPHGVVRWVHPLPPPWLPPL